MTHFAIITVRTHEIAVKIEECFPENAFWGGLNRREVEFKVSAGMRRAVLNATHAIGLKMADALNAGDTARAEMLSGCSAAVWQMIRAIDAETTVPVIDVYGVKAPRNIAA